ncbi:hypothetical protein DPMN_194896 [Dreissena polymorpha]|uniref:Uncharacterized protein n=1 Tax=Dreissena polymorpha TaxID=45954 RepID=A0A9D3Y519_DREPO|nr:hypothetical protein DPMN_194896 [Dreissena polymorpha]
MSSTSGRADSRYLEGDGSTAEVQLLDQSLSQRVLTLPSSSKVEVIVPTLNCYWFDQTMQQ